MDESEIPASVDQPTPPPAGELPPGDHPLEIAARAGFGPLSSQAKDVWHGEGTPCVSCGQLVKRDHEECAHCGQDLSHNMLEKMRAMAGPWYVLEHLHPFPGVNLDRVIRQIRRGLLTETSIVRGPGTDYQWRFAVETPGLCRYFGRCWRCHAKVPPTATSCEACHAYLSLEKPTPKTTVKSAAPLDHLSELSAAVDRADLGAIEPNWDDPPRVGRISVTWVAAALIVAVIALLMWVVHIREQAATSKSTPIPRAVAPISAGSQQ